MKTILQQRQNVMPQSIRPHWFVLIIITVNFIISTRSSADEQELSLHDINKRAVPVLSSRRVLSSHSSPYGNTGGGSSGSRTAGLTNLGTNHIRSLHYEADCQWTVQGAHATVSKHDENGVEDANFESKQCLKTQRAYIYRHSLYKQDFRLGYKLELVCYASGIPRPQITWKKGNKEITTQSSDNRHIHEYHIDDYSVKGKLEIDPSTQGDEGGYTCIASNAIGIDSKTFQAEFIKAT